MSTFKKCDDVDPAVREMVNRILAKHESHKPVLDAKVNIDLGFAYADKDDAGNPTGSAMMSRGFRTLGITRKISLKDRTLGRGDAEIVIDGDWWEDADNDKQREALLDHELHHLEVKTDEDGGVLKDDLGRPLLKLRRHDYEIGWFRQVAERNGKNSVEQVQAASLMEDAGQYFWPEMLRLVPEPKNRPTKVAA